MIRKSLIAFAAVATLGLGMASTAQAKTNIDVDFGFGFGGYGPGYGYGYGDWYEGDDCFYKIKSVKKWNHAHTKYKIVKRKVLVCY